MTELERYVLEEHVEDFRDGLIGRRELLRRVTLITGSLAATMTVLTALGCDVQAPRPPAAAGSAAAPSPSPSPDVLYATPPPTGTADGITVKPDDPRLAAAERVEFPAADGGKLIGYAARPKAAAAGRAPVVLVVHENRGLQEHIRDVCRRLATAGFVGVSVDLLSRQGGAETLSDAGAYSAELAKRPAADMVADLQAALRYAGGIGDAARQGTVGFCFGGGMVWNLVVAGAALKAAIPFYGPAPQNVAGLGTTKTAVFAVYAEQDTRITGTAPQMEEQLKRSGTPYQITVYPGVNHAFHNDTNAPPRYGAMQAQQAWVATIDWFRKYL